MYFSQERTVGVISPSMVFTSLNKVLSFTCKYESNIKWFFSGNNLLPVSAPISFKSRITIALTHPGFLYCYGQTGNKHYVDRAFVEVASKQKKCKLVHSMRQLIELQLASQYRF